LSKAPSRPAFEIAGLSVKPGRSASGELPLPKLVTGTHIAIPVQVFHGRNSGPVVWLSAAVHGDEIEGIEIIRRITATLDPKQMSGTVIAVPIVNVHGFLNSDRYLPDRRDLNRFFPGSAKGSLASRIANLFMKEIVSHCDVGIDFHTGSDHRVNLSQIRADIDDVETRRLAEVFGAPIIIHARVRDGSLRGAATEEGAKVLLFEGGEAWRFDQPSIESGVNGVKRVFSELGIIEAAASSITEKPVLSRHSSWIRARRSGLALISCNLGDWVEEGQTLGVIHDSLGKRLGSIRAKLEGIVIGRIQHPLVNQGDAMIHIAEVEKK
jgi:predicted deacylase